VGKVSWKEPIQFPLMMFENTPVIYLLVWFVCFTKKELKGNGELGLSSPDGIQYESKYFVFEFKLLSL